MKKWIRLISMLVVAMLCLGASALALDLPELQSEIPLTTEDVIRRF